MTHSNYFSLISAQLDALHAQLSGLCNLTLAAASDTVLTAVQINSLLTPMLQTVDSVYDLVDLEAQETQEPAQTDPALQPPPMMQLAHGRWIEVLTAAGIQESTLGNTRKMVIKDGRGMYVNSLKSCPACGAKDSFRFDDASGHGTYFCNHCGNGCGIDLLQKYKGWGFAEAAKFVENTLWVKPSQEATTPEPTPTNPALQPPTLFDEQLARMKAEAPAKVKPCIEREYVRIESIRSSMGMHPYAPAKIAAVAGALLALDGESLTPIVVYKVADNDYELIHGELELLAAHHARDKAPDFEEIVAFVVRDSAGQEAMTRYLDAFLGFQVSPQLDAQEATAETRPCIEREYISLEDIRPCHAAHMAFYKNDYSYEQVATAANALIALDGNPLTPLVVRELSANEYTLIYGELELLAATYASKINPNFEEVQAFVVRDDVDDKATADYLAAFVGFEKVEG